MFGRLHIKGSLEKKGVWEGTGNIDHPQLEDSREEWVEKDGL